MTVDSTAHLVPRPFIVLATQNPFCVDTLTTVGFGDLSPDTGIAKPFTAFYILAGIGLIVAFANTYLSLVVKMREATSTDGD